jgi:hypothetical protein
VRRDTLATSTTLFCQSGRDGTRQGGTTGRFEEIVEDRHKSPKIAKDRERSLNIAATIL